MVGGLDFGLSITTRRGFKEILPGHDLLGAAGSKKRVIAIRGSGFTVIGTCFGGCSPEQGEGDGFGQSPVGGGAGTGPTTVHAGPLGKPLELIDRCQQRAPAAPVDPVASGDTVAWRGCDATSIAVLDGEQRTDVAAAGLVVALAAHGERLAWVEARPGRRSAVRAMDVGERVPRTVGTLKPLSEQPQLALSLGSNGRLRVTLERQPCCGEIVCQTRDAVGDGPLKMIRGRTCRQTLVDGGAVGVSRRGNFKPDRLISYRAGGRTVLARFRRPFEFAYATDGANRIAYRGATCTEHRIVLRSISQARRAPLARCPVGRARRRVVVPRRGVLTIPLRCPKGCRVSGALDVPGRRRPARSVGEEYTERGRGGTVGLRFDLSRRSRQALRNAAEPRTRLFVFPFDGGSERLELTLVRRRPS